MNSQDAVLTNRPTVTLSAQDSQKHKEVLKQFEAWHKADQEDFNYSEEDTYFLVSTKFLESWRDFCLSHQGTRQSPISLNDDLLDSIGVLRPGLKQGTDFQILTERVFKLISDFPSGKVLKRHAVKLGSEKRVPVYLNTYWFLSITNLQLKQIDQKQKKRSDFALEKIEESELSTVEDILKNIREVKEFDEINYEVRLWRIDKKDNLDTLFSYLKIAVDRATYEYRIKGFGKKLDPANKIQNLQMEEGDFFLVEVKDKGKKWFLQSDTEKKCEGCYDLTQLKFICQCEKVAYCTEQCKQKDKRFHLRNCDFAEMEELNKPVDMKMTSESCRGVVGLRNLGNTCFMNSCLQCLSNTTPLTDYFLKGIFEKEVNKVNPLGSKGKLAKTYAKFIKGMWCDSDNVFSPDSIKGAVSSIAPMFSGYAQHDSQQFFSFLVDGLHQDLNRIDKKPYVQSVESNNRPDEVVATESWIAHIKRNQSIVTDLMTGQYKSKVTCPDCKKQSITFDPFITITLPIPQKVTNVMEAFVIYKNFQSKTKKIGFIYEKAIPQEWTKKVAEIVGLDEKEILMYIVSMNEGIYRAGRESTAEIMHKIQSESKNMFAIQLSPEEMNYKNSIQIAGRFSKKGYYSNSDYQNIWFKFPFFFEKQTTNGLTIIIKMLKFLYAQAFDDSKPRSTFFGGKSYEEYEQLMLKKRPFQVHMRHARRLERYFHKLQYKFDQQLHIKDDDRLEDILKGKDQRECQLDIRFLKGALQSFSFQKLKDFEDHGKKIKASNGNTEDVTVDLSQCFETMRESEQLQTGNEWFCPSCKEHKLARKQMSIFKAPKIMILHLKRFKQKGMLKKEKNESKVIFPTQLNMRDYLIDPRPMSSYGEEAKKQGVFIEPQGETISSSSSQEPKYQLYAVSNHYGGLGGGHYTAYAKNGGKWYDFNDSSVRGVSEGSVCSSGAYMLFYKRLDE